MRNLKKKKQKKRFSGDRVCHVCIVFEYNFEDKIKNNDTLLDIKGNSLCNSKYINKTQFVIFVLFLYAIMGIKYKIK